VPVDTFLRSGDVPEQVNRAHTVILALASGRIRAVNARVLCFVVGDERIVGFKVCGPTFGLGTIIIKNERRAKLSISDRSTFLQESRSETNCCGTYAIPNVIALGSTPVFRTPDTVALIRFAEAELVVPSRYANNVAESDQHRRRKCSDPLFLQFPCAHGLFFVRLFAIHALLLLMMSITFIDRFVKK